MVQTYSQIRRPISQFSRYQTTNNKQTIKEHNQEHDLSQKKEEPNHQASKQESKPIEIKTHTAKAAFH